MTFNDLITDLVMNLLFIFFFFKSSVVGAQFKKLAPKLFVLFL